MNAVRTAFLAAAEAVGPLIAARAVAQHWDEPSALAEFSVRGLTGHLARCVATVPRYLAQPEPRGAQPIPAAAYYDLAVRSRDIHAPDHVSIRARGEELAAEGHEALVELLGRATSDARSALAVAPEDRLVSVLKDIVMRLDDYLLTRIVEVTVHADDLAASIGVPAPDLPSSVLDLSIGYLTQLARFRHGDVAVLRALTRRERDEVDALRVL